MRDGELQFAAFLKEEFFSKKATLFFLLDLSWPTSSLWSIIWQIKWNLWLLKHRNSKKHRAAKKSELIAERKNLQQGVLLLADKIQQQSQVIGQFTSQEPASTKLAANGKNKSCWTEPDPR